MMDMNMQLATMGMFGGGPLSGGRVIGGFGAIDVPGMGYMNVMDLDNMGKNGHVEEISIDDFMETLIEALDTDADVFESDRTITSDTWFGKKKSSSGPTGIKFSDPMDIFNDIYGNPRFGMPGGMGPFGRMGRMRRGYGMGGFGGYGMGGYGGGFGYNYTFPSYGYGGYGMGGYGGGFGYPHTFPSYGPLPSYGPPPPSQPQDGQPLPTDGQQPSDPIQDGQAQQQEEQAPAGYQPLHQPVYPQQPAYPQQPVYPQHPLYPQAPIHRHHGYPWHKVHPQQTSHPAAAKSKVLLMDNLPGGASSLRGC